MKKMSVQEFIDKSNIEIIQGLMKSNNGYITSKQVTELGIHRMYLNIMKKKGMIEQVERGIYISTDIFQDDFYTFQQKYKKIIFSHMNALFFYNMTEEIPYNFTITVPYGYHDSNINKKCNVFYVDKDIYELGIQEVKTPNGNTVRVYDIDRCMCDIIKSRNRMDFEQVKKAVKNYVKCKDKNIENLSFYAKKMNISDKVFEMVGMYYE